METVRANGERVLGRVLEVVGEVLKIPVAEIDTAAPFISFGLDSIVAMEVMAKLAKSLDMAITPTIFAGAECVDDLAAALGESWRPPEDAPAPAAPEAAVERVSGDRTAAPDSLARRYADFALATYGVRLPKRDFTSPQAVVDYLVGAHLPQLSAHYQVSHGDHGPGPRARADVDVAVIGLSCAIGQWADAESLWVALREGAVISDVGAKRGARAPNWEARLLEQIHFALADASRPLASLRSAPIGLFVTTAEGAAPVSVTADQMAAHLGSSGPCETIASDPRGAALALLNAYQALRLGECELAIVAAVGGFGVGSPAAGACVVVLARSPEAQAAGHRSYATLKGCFRYGGAPHPHSNPHAMQRALVTGYAAAGVAIGRLRYVELAGEVTPWQLALEHEALLGAAGVGEPVWSTGSLAVSAGGQGGGQALLGLITLALAFRTQSLPGPAAFTELRLDGKGVVAGINASVSGGSGIHIIVEEVPATETEPDTGGTELFVLSADSHEELAQAVEHCLTGLRHSERAWVLRDLAFSSQVGCDHQAARLAVEANSVADLCAKLAELDLSRMECSDSMRTKGLYLTSRPALKAAGDVSASVDFNAALGAMARGGGWGALASAYIDGAEIEWRRAWTERNAQLVPLPRGAVVGGAAPRSAAVALARTPQNELERVLLNQWWETLGAEATVQSGFFGLGGSEQQAATALAAINGIFADTLAPADFVRADSPAALAQRLAGDRRALDTLVSMSQSRAEPHLYLLPGAGGGLVAMAGLSAALAPAARVYGLQALGLGGGTPAASIGESASIYLKALLNSLPAGGRVHLVGYSNGGVVVYELARLLRQLGTGVGAIVLLDSIAPTARDFRVSDEIVNVTAAFMQASYGQTVDIDRARFAQLERHEQKAHLFEVLCDVGLEMGRSSFEKTFDIAVASDAACRDYRPERLLTEVELHLIRATDSYKELPRDLGWGVFSQLPIRVHELATDHAGLLAKPYVDEVAQLITTLLAAPRTRGRGARARGAATAGRGRGAVAPLK